MGSDDVMLTSSRRLAVLRRMLNVRIVMNNLMSCCLVLVALAPPTMRGRWHKNTGLSA